MAVASVDPMFRSPDHPITRSPDDSLPRFSFWQRCSLWLISSAGYLLIRCVGHTLRYQMVCEEGSLTDGRGNVRGIWCFWHRSVIPAVFRFRGQQLAVMISRSFDGEYIARITRWLGYRPVRGSSSRGAVGALVGMRHELEAGHPAIFTIDGPRGPRYIAKPGPVMLSKQTGQPISCFYIAVKPAWILNSWDRMIVPMPFSRACGWFSAPMLVPPAASEQEMSALLRQVQETLERCRHKAEEELEKSGDRVIG